VSSFDFRLPMRPMGVRDELPTRWRANVYRNRQADRDGLGIGATGLRSPSGFRKLTAPEPA
jgi:hypothetical protein